MKLTEAQEQRLRELRSEAAMLGHVVNSQEFHEAAADAIRIASRCTCNKGAR